MFKDILNITSNYPKATRVLNIFKNFVLRKAKSNLRSRVGRSALEKSLKGKISKHFNRDARGRFTGGSTVPSLTFEMNHYGEYVDQGVRGLKSSNRAIGSPYRFGRNGNKRYVNLGAIRRFMQKKGIRKKGAEFAIARSIYNKGIRRSLFFTKPFEQRYPAMVTAYHKAVATDIAVNIANKITKQLRLAKNIV